ncbi:Hypothetical protein A7982_02903 [Minicystis rosea]|nr:Hypothetical protein A7982_02903 [Minicystis rosea]
MMISSEEGESEVRGIDTMATHCAGASRCSSAKQGGLARAGRASPCPLRLAELV